MIFSHFLLLQDSVLSRVRDAFKDSTCSQYSTKQAEYVAWCGARSICPLPVEEQTLVVYITELLDRNLSGPSLDGHVSAIKKL